MLHNPCIHTFIHREIHTLYINCIHIGDAERRRDHCLYLLFFASCQFQDLPNKTQFAGGEEDGLCSCTISSLSPLRLFLCCLPDLPWISLVVMEVWHCPCGRRASPCPWLLSITHLLSHWLQRSLASTLSGTISLKMLSSCKLSPRRKWFSVLLHRVPTYKLE